MLLDCCMKWLSDPEYVHVYHLCSNSEAPHKITRVLEVHLYHCRFDVALNYFVPSEKLKKKRYQDNYR